MKQPDGFTIADFIAKGSTPVPLTLTLAELYALTQIASFGMAVLSADMEATIQIVPHAKDAREILLEVHAGEGWNNLNDKIVEAIQLVDPTPLFVEVKGDQSTSSRDLH